MFGSKVRDRAEAMRRLGGPDVEEERERWHREVEAEMEAEERAETERDRE